MYIVPWRIPKWLYGLCACITVLVIASGLYIFGHSTNPLPQPIKKQVKFQVVYPKSNVAHIDPGKYSYSSNSNVLTFTAQTSNASVVFSEQPVPNNLGTDTAAYLPILGIHPYAEFLTNLGLVALTKFWQNGGAVPISQSAILVSHGTLVTGNTTQNLTTEQWKTIFDNLSIAR